MPDPVTEKSSCVDVPVFDAGGADQVFRVRPAAEPYVLYLNGENFGEPAAMPLGDMRLPVPHMYSA